MDDNCFGFVTQAGVLPATGNGLTVMTSLTIHIIKKPCGNSNVHRSTRSPQPE